MEYDAQGNLSNKNGQAYVFDYGNRLREVPGKEAYRYDGLGRRVMSSRPTSHSLFQYSQSGQLLYEEHSDRPNGVHVYLAGSLIATRYGDGAVKYQHTDALGSPVAVTNAQGQVIERHDYEPYGAIIGKPTRSGIGYTGHMMDGATGLTYMQQRYYDQSVGRFLSVDPVTADGGTGANFNRYKYAANNPYFFIDPDGRVERSTISRESYGVSWLKGFVDGVQQEYTRFVSLIQKEKMNGSMRPTFGSNNSNGYKYGQKLSFTFVFLADLAATGGEGAVAYADEVSGFVRASNGALTGITQWQAKRIQYIANRRGVTIDVIGSRARGNAHSFSDWDYVIAGGNSRARQKAYNDLPAGLAGGELRRGRWTGKENFIDKDVYSDEMRIRFEPEEK